MGPGMSRVAGAGGREYGIMSEGGTTVVDTEVRTVEIAFEVAGINSFFLLASANISAIFELRDGGGGGTSSEVGERGKSETGGGGIEISEGSGTDRDDTEEDAGGGFEASMDGEAGATKYP